MHAHVILIGIFRQTLVSQLRSTLSFFICSRPVHPLRSCHNLHVILVIFSHIFPEHWSLLRSLQYSYVYTVVHYAGE